MDNVQIFNAVLSQMDLNWAARVPIESRTSVAEIGRMLTADELKPFWNQWLGTLLNKIGKTVIRDRVFNNRLARFKSGTMEYGDIIEEIGADILTAQKYEGPELYDPHNICLPNPYCKTKPDAKSNYHRRNREEFYEQTIFHATLKKAFSAGGNGFQTFINGLVAKMSKSNTIDQYIWTKQLFADYITKPQIPLAANQTIGVAAPTGDVSGRAWLKQLKTTVEDLSFPSTQFNPMQMTAQSDTADMTLFVRRGIQPIIDVDTMAGAFHSERLDNGLTQIIVDDFGDFGSAPDDVLAVLCENDWFMIYENDSEFADTYNPKGRYWKYYYHIWETYATSYFANCVVFRGK